MQIRRLTQNEKQSTRFLYEEVFSQDSQSFVEYYYTEKTKDNQVYVIEGDGEVQAMLHLNPYQIMVNGEEKNANYIVAVATRKPYRKRGYMAELLRKALHDMYRAGEAFTFLMPAADAIYLPYDFRRVYEQKKRLYEGELPEAGAVLPVEEEGILYEISELSEEECEELAQAAEEYLAAHYQVYAKRDGAYYARLKKEYGSDGGKLMVYRKGGQIVDCRLYEPEKEKEEDEEGWKPTIMIRPVDVRRLLMSVSLKTLTACCFTVTDPIIEENNRCLVMTGTEFSGVMLMEGKGENSEGTLPVAALGEFLFGAKDVEELCTVPGVQMSERLKEEFKKIVPWKQIYLEEMV